jgi:hypothetical protein
MSNAQKNAREKLRASRVSRTSWEKVRPTFSSRTLRFERPNDCSCLFLIYFSDMQNEKPVHLSIKKRWGCY